MGRRASYSWISTNVGLVTIRVSLIPRPSATARVSWVLPAPRGPVRPITAPGKSNSPRRCPNARVASRPPRSAWNSCWLAKDSLCTQPVASLVVVLLLVLAFCLAAQERLAELVNVAVEHLLDLGRLDPC